jgi:hypothetical protein
MSITGAVDDGPMGTAEAGGTEPPKPSGVYVVVRSVREIPKGSKGLDALRRRALLALLDVELYRLALDQRLTTLALNLGVVREHVGLTRDLDEAEALLVVEPLYFSCSHLGPPLILKFQTSGSSALA